LLIRTYTVTQERVWIARYDFDFSADRLPGLILGLKYAKDPTLLSSAQAASLWLAEVDGKEWNA
jgi:hypothetical protein